MNETSHTDYFSVAVWLAYNIFVQTIVNQRFLSL